jgi:hypothetical protein
MYVCLFKGLLVFSMCRLEQIDKKCGYRNKKSLTFSIQQINIGYETSQGGVREKFN